jgi:hypothetical protein
MPRRPGPHVLRVGEIAFPGIESTSRGRFVPVRPGSAPGRAVDAGQDAQLRVRDRQQRVRMRRCGSVTDRCGLRSADACPGPTDAGPRPTDAGHEAQMRVRDRQLRVRTGTLAPATRTTPSNASLIYVTARDAFSTATIFTSFCPSPRRERFRAFTRGLALRRQPPQVLQAPRHVAQQAKQDVHRRALHVPTRLPA